MKAVVDEGVPRKLVQLLREKGHDIDRFPTAWKGTKNGRLLKLIQEAGFTCLLTSDKNMVFQQNLQAVSLAILVLPNQKLDDLLLHLDAVSEALTNVKIGDVIRLSFSASTIR